MRLSFFFLARISLSLSPHPRPSPRKQKNRQMVTGHFVLAAGSSHQPRKTQLLAGMLCYCRKNGDTCTPIYAKKMVANDFRGMYFGANIIVSSQDSSHHQDYLNMFRFGNSYQFSFFINTWRGSIPIYM